MAQVAVVPIPTALADRPRTQQSEDTGHHGEESMGQSIQLLAQSWAAQKAGKPSAGFPLLSYSVVLWDGAAIFRVGLPSSGKPPWKHPHTAPKAKVHGCLRFSRIQASQQSELA